ncbi:unnamed protein product [Closterium sp. NIES-53]
MALLRYLLSDSKDSVSLFDLASGAATAPPATADSSTRSQWLTRDAAARLAIRNHRPLAECTHFGQHRTAQALYDAVDARYSSPATAALGHLLLPYRFPELSAFATIEDLVSHLRASDARYRAAVHAEFLDRKPPPMYITLYFIVTRLPDSLRSVRDQFLSLDPTSLTVDLIEQHLLASETSAVAVGAARGTPLPPFFEGCSPSPLAPSYASAAAADVSVPKDVGAASTSAKRRSSKGKGGRGGGGGSAGGGGGRVSGGGGSNGGGGGGGTVGGSGGSGGGGGGSGGSGVSGGGGIGGGGTGARHVGSGGGQRQQQQRRGETLSPQQLRACFLRGASGGSCPYVIRTGDRAGQTCGRLHTQQRCFSRLDDAWRAEFGDDIELPRWADLLKSRIAILDLDFDAILFAMYALSVSAEGDCYRCVLPDLGIAAAALGASESGTVPGTVPAEVLHTFTLDSGASRCFFRDSTTLTPLPAPVPIRLTDPSGGPIVARSSINHVSDGFRPAHCQVFTSPRSLRTWSDSRLLLVSPPFAPDSSMAPPPGSPLPASPSWHALSSSCLWSPQVSTSPAALACPALPPLRQGVAAHPFSLLLVSPDDYSPAYSPHGRVGPSPRQWTEPRAYFLLVVDDYTRYTTIFPLRSKGEVIDFLIPWIRTVRLQLRERFGQDLPVLRLHFDRGGDFSSNLLRDFCCGEGILQSFTLPDSPHQNGIAERRIGLVMEFYHPTSLRVFHSQDLTFDESVPFYQPLPPKGPAPSGVSQVDPLPGPAPVQVAVDSGAARRAASGGAASGGAESEGAETWGAEPGGVETGEGAESGGSEPQSAAGSLPSLSPQRLREWFVRRTHLRSGASGTGGAGPAGARVAAGAGVTGGTATTGPGGAHIRGTGAARTSGVEGTGARDLTKSGTTGAGVGGPGVGGAGAGGAGAGGAGAVDPGGAVQPRPYFFPLLQQVLGTPPSAALTPPLLCPPPNQSQPPLQPASPLPAPSPYTEQSGGLTKRCEPASCPVSPVRTAHRVPRSRPHPFPGTHTRAIRPSYIPVHVPLRAPPESYLPEVPDPESDRARAASPIVSRLLASAVTDPSFESAIASALLAELLDFAASCRLDYATALVAESASSSPPSVGGECALGTDVLEDGQEDFECLAAAVPRFASMLLALKGDPDAADIPTPRSYAEAITGPYSSQWQAAMDAEMASWKSTGTYVDEVPPLGANIVDGMWIFRGVDYFQTFSPTPKMTTLRVLLHVPVQRDYELHSLDFSTAFLQGSLHEEI